MNELIEFWKIPLLNDKPYIHPNDNNVITDFRHSYKGIEDYYENTYWNDKGIFHTDLLPVPYIGDLKKATIFLLFLNPGFSIDNYFVEELSEDFKDALKSNIKQDFENSEYPFFYLNPKFMWTGGGKYWLQKLKDYILQIKKTEGISYTEATKYLSKKVAVLQLIPYHSVNFTRHNLLSKLDSSRKMKRFVEEYLIPKAKENKIGIICTRQAKTWELPEHENIVVYGNPESRGAHISRNSKAEPIFKKFLTK